MITKVETIRNIGSYKTFDWNTLDDFKSYNFIYGENGSGKTILSKLISLYSSNENEVSKSEITKELFEDNAEIKLIINGKSEKCIGTSFSKKDIYVFNSLFISNNLYDGSNTNIKLFDMKDDTKLENIEIKKRKEEMQTIETKVGDKTSGLIKKKNDYEKAFNENKKVISAEFNKKITDRNIQLLEKNISVPNKSIDIVEKEIELLTSEYNLQSKNDFEDDINRLNKIIKNKIIINLDLIEKSLNTEINVVAKQNVIEKIESMNRTFSDENKGNEWIENSLLLLQHQKKIGDFTCPLCNSNLIDEIDNIIFDYESYFNKEFENLQHDLDKYKDELLKIRNDVLIMECPPKPDQFQC